MLGGADNPNGELLSYIIGADNYNRWRRHSTCGGLSPEQFENQNLA
nr:IS3 family transposase [Escherichia sp. MOD1-EC7003]